MTELASWRIGIPRGLQRAARVLGRILRWAGYLLAYVLALALLHGTITYLSGGVPPAACEDCRDDPPPLPGRASY